MEMSLLWILMAIAAFSAVAVYSGAAVTSNANGALSIMNLNVAPHPVVSGENVTISFNLYNSYTSSLDNVDLGLIASNPIINVSPAFSYITQAIGEGMYQGFINPFVFKVHIPSNLQQGLYVINVTATYQTTQNGQDVAGSSVMPIFIYVYGNPSIGVNVAPGQNIVPGVPFPAGLTLINYGSGTAYNTTAYINNSTLVPIGQDRVVFGNIGGGGSSTQQITFEAAQNVTAGTNFVNITLKYQSGTGQNLSKNVDVPIGIVLNRPRIALSILSSSPTQLYTGSNQTITMLVQNIGTGTAKNVSLDLLGNNYLFPSSSATHLFIGSLSPGNATTEVFTIDANSSGGSSSSFPIRASYYSSNYLDRYNSTINLPISVAPSSIFQVESVRSNVTVGSTYKPVTFTVKNTGNENAQQVSLTLQSIYPITPADSTAYIDNISAGGTTNVTFYIDVAQNGAPGQYPATIYEQWRQPNGNANQQYSGSTSYYIDVSNSAKKGNPTGPIIGVFVIAVIAVVGYRTYRKRRASSKQQPKKKEKG